MSTGPLLASATGAPPGIMEMDLPMTPPQSRSEQRTRLLLGLVLLVAFLAYANTLLHSFVYDDHFQIDANPYVHSFRYVGRIFTTTVWSFQGAEGQTNYYRPLMTFGYLLCDRVFQSSPIGFHLVNLLLNCAVVWLVFAVCKELFADEAVALVAAALFALHPIHTEVVAWVAAVTELDLALFYLLGFLLFVRLGKDAGKPQLSTLLWMSASFVLALLSKEQGITLPVMATVYEHCYRADRNTSGFARKVSRYGPLWAIAALYMLFRVTVLRAFAPVTQRPDLSPMQVVFSAIALAGQYVAKLVWPQPLLGFYIFQESRSLSDPQVLGGLAALLVCCVLFAFLYKTARPYSFAFVWMAVTILPVLNVRWMAASAFAERYLYLPSLGFCALVAGAVVWFWRRAENVRWARWIGAAAAVLLAAAATVQIVTRNRVWRDDKSFFTATLAATPRASYMRTSMGAIEWSEFHPDAAIKDWQLALAVKPDNAIALSDLGMAMIEQKRWPEAEAYLRKAVQLKPRFMAPHLHLGKMYVELGRTSDAESEFRRAVEISPLSAEARNAFGRFLLQQGRQPEAEAQYRASLESSPNSEAWDGLAEILAVRGSRDEAAACWQRALELLPFDQKAHLGLGGVYLSRGEASAAEKEYRAVLLLDPHDAGALKGMHALKPTEFPQP